MGHLYAGGGIHPAYILATEGALRVIDNGDGHLVYHVGRIHVVVEQAIEEDATHEHEQHGEAVADGIELAPSHTEGEGMFHGEGGMGELWGIEN